MHRNDVRLSIKQPFTTTEIAPLDGVLANTGAKMQSNKIRLTDKSIKAAAVGETLRDNQVPGLHVRIFEQRRSFYLYYRTAAGVERRPKLGDFPYLDVKTARKKAADMLSEVAAGRDPSKLKQEQRHAPDLTDLRSKFVQTHSDKRKSGKAQAYYFDEYILPKLGKRTLVKDIGYDDVYALHESMKTTPFQANRVLQTLSTAMRLCEKWKWRDAHTNPCTHVSRFPEPRRRRKMETNEAMKIGAALRTYEHKYPNAAAFIWLLIFTGARPNEIARAMPADIKGNKIILAEHKTAHITQEARVIYFPEFVKNIINGLPITEGETLLGIKSPRKLWERIRSECGCDDLQLRDLRRSYASVALGAGYQLDQIGELFNHRTTQTTYGYAWLADEVASDAAEQIGAVIKKRMFSPA